MKRVTRVLFTTGVAAALAAGLSTSAHADGWVTWQHDVSGKCLGADSTIPFQPNDVRLYDYCTSYGAQWYEVYNGSDGTYLLEPKEDTGTCLAAYWDNDVYVEDCTAGNAYQRWYEVRTSDGWKLKHKATGRFIDSNGKDIYLHDENGGRYQLWH
ncbi:RICIN domain-containing protein [Streptomyces sp. VRA16 Mangrove soil]|uniref:RICIN domain-containing protein n=1 Tax=Streptomyces sp. VRA16 Mangrove soil TaxID=2817434 RepID=UPI001A9D8E20|nr:RICIN domain-containing protein [Streptomyces sp. VRA16 Mangrove soil]MBO1331360.1 RICIN domain-containing protein [Streptomyces sp. VRA16 Mangrove soil]